jgi:carboxypeptidase PM20D1
VLAHVRATVRDPRIRIGTLPKQREPSPLSRADGEGWDLLARSVREMHPDVIVAPYLMLAGTDSRHFCRLTESVYRFMPLRLPFAETHGIHGINERVSVEGYADLVRSYRRLLENAAASPRGGRD